VVSSSAQYSFTKEADHDWVTIHYSFCGCCVCYKCERFQHVFKATGCYVGSNVQISALFRTDLQQFYWRNPLCQNCVETWLTTDGPKLQRRLSQALVRLQRWWRQVLYSPPCSAWPRGGRLFRREEDLFYRHCQMAVAALN